MTKRILTLLLAVTFTLGMLMLPASASEITLSLHRSDVVVRGGKTYKFEAKTNSKQTVKWSSSNEKSATVDGDGNVKALRNDTVTITAEVEGKKASAKIEFTSQGRTTGHTSYRGLVVESGDWIYFMGSHYRNGGDFGGLFKMKYDGSEKEMISEDYLRDLHVLGNWIYFIDSAGLNRIKTDGTEKKLLRAHLPDTMSSNSVSVVGDWIFFDEHPDFGSGCREFYRMKTDGNKAELLADNPSFWNWRIIGSWAYCTDSNNLFRIRTDGSKTQVFDKDGFKDIKSKNDRGRTDISFSGSYAITEGWIYYVDSINGKMCKVRINGKDNKRIGEGNWDFAVSGNWIYYINEKDGKKLYRIRTDGKQNQKLHNVAPMNYSVEGKYIYYSEVDKVVYHESGVVGTYGEGSVVRRMDLNGKNKILMHD